MGRYLPCSEAKEMNKIKFEFFKSCADIASAEYDGTDKLLLIFPTEEDGYLSIGPRIIKAEGGQARVDLVSVSDGVQDCYLCINGERIELPKLEKIGRLFRMSTQSDSSAMARVAYLKEQEDKMAELEERLAIAEEKIFGRKGIL
jgi:hypothetical protein